MVVAEKSCLELAAAPGTRPCKAEYPPGDRNGRGEGWKKGGGISFRLEGVNKITICTLYTQQYRALHNYAEIKGG